MSQRTRKIPLLFYVTEEEKKTIFEHMHELEITNFSLYARKMCCDGYFLKLDFSELKNLNRELSAQGRNLNQIAKVLNETHNPHFSDILEIKKHFEFFQKKFRKKILHLLHQEL